MGTPNDQRPTSNVYANHTRAPAAVLPSRPMAHGKLSSGQLAQLAFLETLPTKFERINRHIEEMATLRADDMQTKNLVHLLDSLRNEAHGLTLTSLADTLGMMASLARRGGGRQMRIRGLREGLVSLRTNYEGEMKGLRT